MQTGIKAADMQAGRKACRQTGRQDKARPTWSPEESQTGRKAGRHANSGRHVGRQEGDSHHLGRQGKAARSTYR